jgi:hypothetical protein
VEGGAGAGAGGAGAGACGGGFGVLGAVGVVAGGGGSGGGGGHSAVVEVWVPSVSVPPSGQGTVSWAPVVAVTTAAGRTSRRVAITGAAFARA